MADDDALVPVELTEDQRELLVTALNQWGGPAYGTEEIAVAMGFESHEWMLIEIRHLQDAIVMERPLTPRDWTRVLLATEISFTSSVVGAGGEWGPISGVDERDTFDVLRSLQQVLSSTTLRPQLDGRSIFWPQ